MKKPFFETFRIHYLVIASIFLFGTVSIIIYFFHQSNCNQNSLAAPDEFGNLLFILWLTGSLLILLLGILISRQMNRQFKEFKNAIQEVGKGNLSVTLSEGKKGEMGVLAKEFNQMIQQLRQLSDEFNSERFDELRSVIDGQELERQRLSRELHDGLGQLLIAIKLKLESINHTDMSKIRYMISHVKELFDKTIDEIRKISNDLMPTVLNEFGLEKAMRRLCDEISEYAKIRVKYTFEGEFDALNKTTKMYIYRIAQEALSNTYKYAEANSLIVSLKQNDKMIYLEIEDNGKGFNFESENAKKGNGLRNMSERTLLLGGNIEFKTAR